MIDDEVQHILKVDLGILIISSSSFSTKELLSPEPLIENISVLEVYTISNY